MENAESLRSRLRSIDHKPYPAYKSLAGSYQFQGYVLNIEHVQGDPFAAPSSLSVYVPLRIAAFPEEYYSDSTRRTAMEDFLLRAFARKADSVSFQARGSGKSGMFSVTHPGQEVYPRSSLEIGNGRITVRFEVGFPANGRSINAGELEKILFNLIPQSVGSSLLYTTARREELKAAVELSVDQCEIRKALRERKLAAFVADGSILPRESGVSDRPMRGAVPTRSPENLRVELDLPYRGTVSGLGIPVGVTLIAGGGYHGKSTLLEALERGVYNHILGDGRELVITDDTAVKLRAEDGRKVTDVDISLFIRDLPVKTDTRHFSTLDASGSTSQAAAVIEGIEAGTKLFLIDEDTSATNLMVRDELMQRVISRAEEPIIPYASRVRELYEKAGISTILVIGSSGSYFEKADLVLQMDCYRIRDITEKARAAECSFRQEISGSLSGQPEFPDFQLPEIRRTMHLSSGVQMQKSYRGDHVSEQRLKIRQMGKTAFTVGKQSLDLRYVEQIVDAEQTRTLAFLVRAAEEHFSGRDGVDISSEELFRYLRSLLRSGFAGIASGERNVPSGLAMVRIQDVCACFDRL